MLHMNKRLKNEKERSWEARGIDKLRGEKAEGTQPRVLVVGGEKSGLGTVMGSWPAACGDLARDMEKLVGCQ